MKIFIVITLLLGLCCSKSEAKTKNNNSVTVSSKFVRKDSGSFSMMNTVKEDSLKKKDETPTKEVNVESHNISKYIYGSILFVIASVLIVSFFRRRTKYRMIIDVDNNTDGCIEKDVEGVDNIDNVEESIEQTQDSIPESLPLYKKESSNDKHDRFSVDKDDCVVIGASVRGKGHIQTELPCQDSNKYTYLTGGWGVAVVSDGAGSVSKSQIGSRIVVERTTAHVVDVIKKMKWIERNMLPSNEDWAQIAYSVLRRVYGDIIDFAHTKKIEIKDLSATAIVLIHSPLGILSTHIGDGRAGYRNNEGKWLPLIVPHKGEEANQTIFITSQFWDSPSFRMSGQLIPESRVIREEITGFTLMSDGCESTSWQVSQMDKNTGKVCDPNEPFQNFYEPLSKTLIQYHLDRVDVDERAEAWYSFLNTGKEFSREVDDKTLILGIIL